LWQLSFQHTNIFNIVDCKTLIMNAKRLQAME